MGVGKGFASGFGGCLGVGCAVVAVVVGLPIGCIVIGGLGTAVNQSTPRPSTSSPSPSPSVVPVASPKAAKEAPAEEAPAEKAPAEKRYGMLTVTSDDYSQITNGMSYQEVVSIIGFYGEEMSRNKIDGVAGVMPSVETVMYAWKNFDGSNMNAMFQNNKLMQKAQFGLHDGNKRKRDVASRAEREEETRKQQERAAEERRKTQQAEREAAEKRKEAIDKAKWHTWTSANGEYTIEAKFLKATGGIVYLEKKDGTVLKIQRDKLSEEDQKWMDKKGWTKPTE